jgi:hypothetical protein
MPVRVNLLAEALELAEARRRDPVKRAAWAGGALVALALLWALSLWLNARQAAAQLARRQDHWKTLEKNFTLVTQNQRAITEIHRKLISLHQLATHRLLVARPLNALQQAVVEEVHVTRLRLEHVFTQLPETKPLTNANKTVTPAQPPRASEKITLTIDARDFSSPLGNQVSKFKDALLATPFFRQQLNSPDDLRMTGYARQADPNDPSKTFVAFTLECRFPERIR